MSKKNILIIGNYPPPFGGVPRHIEYLVPFLVERGWNVHVLSGGTIGVERHRGFTVYKPQQKEKIKSSLGFLLRFWKIGGDHLRVVSSGNIKDSLRYMSYISIGRKIIENNNISIISAYNLYLYAPIGAVLSQEYGIPLVVTNFGEIFSHFDFFKKNTDLIKYITNTAKQLLAMSNHCAKSYELIGLSPDVKVIPYGVNIRMFSPDNDGTEIRKKLNIGEEDKVVLFVGRLIKDMGLHTLIEAIPLILKEEKATKFLIVGEKGELLSTVSKIREQYKNNVFVVPSAPFEDLPYYYAASTIVAAPTKGDRACGSLASIEAMATGKPVVASNVGGIPEIVIDGETGVLIPPEDPVALAKAITDLIQDDARVKQMGRLAREHVEKFFDEEKADQEIEQIFRSVAGL